MQFIIVVVILALSCPTVLAEDAGTAESTPSQFKDFPTTPMIFNGTIGGIPIVHEGTIQEIVAYMTYKYPGFALDISADIADAADTSSTADVDVARIIPRYNGNWGDGKGHMYCCPVFNQGWGYAISRRIDGGIAYLNRVNGWCGVKARSCARVSCSYNSAIRLCNDRYEDLFANCQWIATFAGDINRDFFAFRRIGNGDALTRGTCGQEFSRDGPYNVINHYDRC